MDGSHVTSPPPLISHRYIMSVFYHFDNRIMSPLLGYSLISEMKL